MTLLNIIGIAGEKQMEEQIIIIENEGKSDIGNNPTPSEKNNNQAQIAGAIIVAGIIIAGAILLKGSSAPVTNSSNNHYFGANRTVR